MDLSDISLQYLPFSHFGLILLLNPSKREAPVTHTAAWLSGKKVVLYVKNLV